MKGARQKNFNDFESIHPIGSGSFGDISNILNRPTKKQYAPKHLKMISAQKKN